ncbi:cytosolic 5'-nucleotidase 3-like isoform X2 [Artemia franciscana]|uniref:cytosolic 5'-nucleotidase 3-like isoform X2 n=1 Tax=Artemia franciscana TaxID=6661 RepID=UPI0032DAAFF2
MSCETLQKYLQTGNVPNGKIYSKNPTVVKEKLVSIGKGGHSKLQVITDFDHTMTKAHHKKKEGLTCDGIVGRSSRVTQEFKDENRRLLHQYYPIEVDPHLTPEEKIPYMQQWYDGIHEALKKCDIYKKDFETMVQESEIHFRDGLDAFVDMTFRMDIPFLIFSAGIGDVIDACLVQHGLKKTNVHTISNFATFAPDGKFIAYDLTKLVLMFNKKQHALTATSYFGDIKQRNNVIVMGDSLGDADMAEGVHEPGTILKIGFLNDEGREGSKSTKTVDSIEERLPRFMEAFDLVLVDDQTFNIPLEILSTIALD